MCDDTGGQDYQAVLVAARAVVLAFLRFFLLPPSLRGTTSQSTRLRSPASMATNILPTQTLTRKIAAARACEGAILSSSNPDPENCTASELAKVPFFGRWSSRTNILSNSTPDPKNCTASELAKVPFFVRHATRITCNMPSHCHTPSHCHAHAPNAFRDQMYACQYSRVQHRRRCRQYLDSAACHDQNPNGSKGCCPNARAPFDCVCGVGARQ